MWPDQVLNPGPLVLESDVLSTALHSPADQHLHYLPFYMYLLNIFTAFKY